MSDGRTQDRLRDALQEIRRQSVAGSGSGPVSAAEPWSDEPVSELEGDSRRPAHRRWWLPATAAAVVLAVAGTFVVAGRVGERETSVTASQTEQELAHARAVVEVTEGCRRYQSARPPEAAPVEAPSELAAWFDRYGVAIAGASATLDRIEVSSNEDRSVLVVAEDALGRARRALDGARAAAESGDTIEAIRLIDQARSYESIAAFELAQWGAAACDARGVTQPTR